ncbi:MAG: hypothetical protein Q9186_005247 [Xanthomendoza sp. 1 TL-2023]
MTDLSTPRRALQDLSVNTHGTPNASRPLTSTTGNLKRSIHEVDDPALPPLASRVRSVNDASALEPKSPQLAPGVESEKAFQISSRENEACAMVVEGTQSTSSGTVSDLLDSDMEACPTDTQQTATTDISQAIQPSTLSRAETLRLRLRVALFKVQTNQTHLPVSQLRISSPKFEERNLSTSPSPKQTNVQPPILLPAPVITPAVRSDRSWPCQMLSSPPITRVGSPSKDADADNFPTPSLPLSRVRLSHQLNSPPNSHDGGPADRQAEDSLLSSSAVKGHAAASLLGLRGDMR